MIQKTVSMRKGKGSLNLGIYPYTYARTCFMRAALLKKADYDKLMKMTANEITEFLQENAYRKEINGLEGKYSGTELVEMALNRNLEEVFSKMRRISNKKNLLKVIDAYLMRYDVRNIKNVLRAKYTNSEATGEDLITASGSYSREFFMKLLKKESVEEILKENGLVAFEAFEDALKAFKETNVLGEIESIFEKKYFSHLFDLAETIPRQGKLFRAFLESEIEITNILNVLRLKRAGVDERSAGRYLLPVRGNFGARLAELMISDISKTSDIFRRTPYAKIIEEGTKKFLESGSLIEFETGLWNLLLNKTKALIHQHPLSVDVIVGYIFAKDMEIRNLKLLIKGKQFGFEDAFIESQLVM
jgi:V/A-type H+/Na+-transporting ATPase subunit C